MRLLTHLKINANFAIYVLVIPIVRTTALGIGARRRKEPCAVERSTEANA